MKRNYVLSGDLNELFAILMELNCMLVEKGLNQKTIFSEAIVSEEGFKQRFSINLDDTEEDEEVFKQLMIALCHQFPQLMIQSHPEIENYSTQLVWFSAKGECVYREILNEEGIPVSGLDLNQEKTHINVSCEICQGKSLLPLSILKTSKNQYKSIHLSLCPHCDSLMTIDNYL